MLYHSSALEYIIERYISIVYYYYYYYKGHITNTHPPPHPPMFRPMVYFNCNVEYPLNETIVIQNVVDLLAFEVFKQHSNHCSCSYRLR